MAKVKKKTQKKQVLTIKQEKFCKAYLITLNATKAALKAGYSKKTAKEQGCENLTKPHIQERIHDLMAKRAKKVEIDAEWVLKGLVKMVKGTKKHQANHAKGLELIGRHLAMFTDVHKHTGKVTLEQMLEQAEGEDGS